jgi:hypothetical protein
MKEIIAALTIVSICFGAWFYVDNKKADCADVQKVDQKADKIMKMMDYKFLALQLETKEDRIFRIEEQSGKIPKDKSARESLEKLKQEKAKILREMEIMEAK